MQAGGIIPATPGGRLVLAGEGGRDEAILPLGGRGLGSTVNVTVNNYGGVVTDGELGDQIEERIHIAMSRGAFA